MERKIGEKFEYTPGVWLEVAAYSGCSECFFDEIRCDIAQTGSCTISARSDGVPCIFRPCAPPAPEIKTAPPPTEWMRGMTEAWQKEIIEAAREAFVCRFWDASNISLSHAMGISEATVRRIRKKRLRKNREQE